MFFRDSVLMFELQYYSLTFSFFSLFTTVYVFFLHIGGWIACFGESLLSLVHRIGQYFRNGVIFEDCLDKLTHSRE